MEKLLFQAALEVQNFFAENGWRFVFIGGLANLRWGQPRTTEDIDGTLLTSFVGEEKIIDIDIDHYVFSVKVHRIRRKCDHSVV